LAITAVVAYVAWQAGVVYQRKAAMRGQHIFMLDRNGGIGVNPIRALVGDEPVRYVYIVPLGDYRSDTARLTFLFPESEVKPIEDQQPLD